MPDTEPAARELHGKVAIVTGAAGLIGSETARLLAAAGAKVVLADLKGDAVKQAADELCDQGYEAAGCDLDLTNESSIAALVDFTVGHFGGIDILDNNAGATALSVVHDQDFLETPIDQWDLIYSVNIRGPMLLIKRALPVMIARGGGSIINISSDAAEFGDLAFAAYGSSKAAINSLTKYIATAFGKQNIRCNAISPGPIRDPSPDATPKPLELEQLLIGNCLVPRLGLPRDIAEAVLFLAGSRAGFVTGQIIAVNGGFMSHWPTTASLRELKEANSKSQKNESEQEE